MTQEIYHSFYPQPSNLRHSPLRTHNLPTILQYYKCLDLEKLNLELLLVLLMHPPPQHLTETYS